MTTPRELVNSFYESIIKGDMELYQSIIHDEYEVSVPANKGVLSGTYGREKVLNEVFPTVVGKLNLEDFTFCKNFKIMCEDENWIVVICEAEGTSISGERYDQTYAHLFSFQDEKIRRLIEFQDTALADRALWGNDTPFVEPDSPLHTNNRYINTEWVRLDANPNTNPHIHGNIGCPFHFGQK